MKRLQPASLTAFILPTLVAVCLFLVQAAVFAQPRGQAGGADRAPEAEFHMARLMYADSSGGRVGGSRGRGGFYRPGWWAIDYPEAEYHFTRGLRRLSVVEVAEDSQHLQLSDDAIFDYPWLFAQQVGRWYLSDEEVVRLREYLDRGGFLVADDFHGEYEWGVFQQTMARVFPDRALQRLDSNDEVFHSFYELDQLTQIPGQRHLYRAANGEIRAQMQGPQAWYGIYDDDGNLVVAINHNMDMGDSWEHADDPYYPEPMTALGYRFGINYVIYAMTH